MAEADLVALKPGASGETLRHIPILNTPTKRQRALYGSVAATLGLSLTLGLVRGCALRRTHSRISELPFCDYYVDV